MRSLAGLLAPAASLALVLVPAQAARAQAPVAPAALETQQRELLAAQDLLVRARAEFEGPQQGRSIVLLDEAISRLEALRGQAQLTPRGREILVEAYELRGRAYFNIGLKEKATESFRALVEVSPQHALRREQVSPKIVDYFDSVKESLVGFLAVSSDPPGARVTLDGEFLGLTDFFPVEVVAGEYAVEVSREGYATETRTVSISPRATETLQVSLTRTAASVFLLTQPAGVEVWVDGELKATTGGGVHPELFEAVRGRGLDPAQTSARTELANLTLGSHVIELRRRCYEPVRTTLEVLEPRDYELEPLRLEDSRAALSLRSDPPGARIFLNGEPLGQTPKDLEGICSGRHRLEVKHAAGKFVQELVLARNEVLTLDCPIRPSLAFLGVVAEGEAGKRMAAEVEARLLENLARIKSLNFVTAPREIVDRTLDAEGLSRARLLPGAGTSPDALRRATERLAAALEVEGFLIAALPEERLTRRAVLHLLAAGNTVSDQWDVNFAESASYLRFLAAVDQKATVYRPWSGLITVDTRLHDGVPVLRTVAGSPAERAGVARGDVLYAVDGQRVARSPELIERVASRRPGERLTLHLRGPSGDRTLELTLGETPQEIPLHDPTLLYNKVMMDLRQQVVGYPGTEAAAFARLNLALCAMHFSDFAAAHEHLLKARGELPTTPGISQGTALYYLGLSLEQLGYREEALDAYRAAAGFPQATLFNNDGPAVAPLAAQRAGS